MLGERAWPSLAALPEVPDHAYILSPTETVVAAVEECGQAGVSVVTILASGFGEAGHEGVLREQKLQDIVARTGRTHRRPEQPWRRQRARASGSHGQCRVRRA